MRNEIERNVIFNLKQEGKTFTEISNIILKNYIIINVSKHISISFNTVLDDNKYNLSEIDKGEMLAFKAVGMSNLKISQNLMRHHCTIYSKIRKIWTRGRNLDLLLFFNCSFHK